MNSLNEANLVEIFLESILAERGLTKNSAASYLSDLKDFIIYFNHRNISVQNITTNHLFEYLSNENLKNFRSSTIARKISTLKQFYLFLLSEELIKENPAQDLEHPKKEIRLPKALSLEKVKLLLKIASQDKSDDGIRNYCMLEMLYSSGMRVSELLQIRISTVMNPNKKHDACQLITINGKGNKERSVILNNQALKALDNYLKTIKVSDNKNALNYLFSSKSRKSKPITRQMFFIIIKKIATKAGIDPTKVSPHKLRHSFASHILENGAGLRDVQDLLGHSDISSTQIYTKVLDNTARDLVFKKHPLSKNID